VKTPSKGIFLWETGHHVSTKLHGKELSYNNLLDVDAAALTLSKNSEGRTYLAPF